MQDNALLLLIAFRLVNALTLRTFFQPDEYYQALEPAWWLAFGDNSGAWMTWVSTLHSSYFEYLLTMNRNGSTTFDLPSIRHFSL